MKEYIKNNNIENGDEILHKYQNTFEEFNDMVRGPISSLKTYVEKGDIFRFCLIHDIRLSQLRYFGREEAEDDMFEQLSELVRRGYNHNVLIGDSFYPCNGGPPRRARFPSMYLFNIWYYCPTCVTEFELIKDVMKKDWVLDIIIKYGFRWYPKTRV